MTFHVRRCWILLLSSARRKKRSVVILHKRLTTQLKATIVPALRVEPEKAPLGVARRSFGMTKPRSSRLDWRFFRLNRVEDETSTNPGKTKGSLPTNLILGHVDFSALGAYYTSCRRAAKYRRDINNLATSAISSQSTVIPIKHFISGRNKVS